MEEQEDRIIGIVDEPNPRGNEDTLDIYRHASALTKFIKYCDTPMTIGIQGEWGSGKTSLLNSITESIDDKYLQIWINSWEHSLLVSPEEALLKIIQTIINEMLASVPSKRNKDIKDATKGFIKGALRVVSSLTLGSKGADVVEEFFNEESNTIKLLREQLEELSREIQEDKEKIVVYVDDLDRIDPKDAVRILELLKNIFSISGCVFVLAIDYQVIVKGLEGKFGKRTEENEWEFRAFFDKIIQLPFMMPMGDYNIGKYVNDLLIKIGFLDDSDKFEDEITKIISYSIGGNPRSLKRLVNSLALINIFKNIDNEEEEKEKITDEKENQESDERINQKNEELKQKEEDINDLLMFSLVCLQISFPKIYELLVKEPDFSNWTEDETAFRVTQKKEEGIEPNEEKKWKTEYALAVKSKDFDEPWEKAIFRICYPTPRYRVRAKDISKLFSYLKDELLKDYKNPDELTSFITEILDETAVTSVSATDDAQSKVTKPYQRNITSDPVEGLDLYFKNCSYANKYVRELLRHVDADMRGHFEKYRFQYSKSMGATLYIDNKQSKIGQISIFRGSKILKLEDNKRVGYEVDGGTHISLALYRDPEDDWKKPIINTKIKGVNYQAVTTHSDVDWYRLLIPNINEYESEKSHIYKLVKISEKAFRLKKEKKKCRLSFKNGSQYNKVRKSWRNPTFKKYVSNEHTYDVT